MSSDVAIRVEDLGKSYTIRHNRSDHITVAELALDRVRHPLARAEREEFWALQDVSFDLHQGELVGVVGRNGAGKSTLLKLISRVTAPTTGRIELYGRVGSLLEVGTGFHPELTGRENIFLNGSILGMSRVAIKRQFDAIVEFAGVAAFLDTPVKRYSSGMYVRLAFTVAAHLDSDILLLDEVLAVGDAQFQRRCLEKAGELARSGRTVVLISHNMSLVRDHAPTSMLLGDGHLLLHGPTSEVIQRYATSGDHTQRLSYVRPRNVPNTGALITAVRMTATGDAVLPGQPITYEVDVAGVAHFDDLRIAQVIFGSNGEAVGTSFGVDRFEIEPGEVTTVSVHQELPVLAPGDYHLGVAVGQGDPFVGSHDLDFVPDTVHFSVAPRQSEAGLTSSWIDYWGRVVLDPPRLGSVRSATGPSAPNATSEEQGSLAP